jgi:hypothetical protein
LTVGVTPGVSVDDADEEDVSAPEDELIELMFFEAPVPISFLGIDFVVPPESCLPIGIELLDSKDGRDSSSLNLDSCEERGVFALPADRSGFGESVLGMFIAISFRCGIADRPPPDVDLDTLLSLPPISD